MDFWSQVLGYIAQGGPVAIIVILAVAVGVLIWDRHQLLKSLNETTQKVYDAKDRETQSIKEIIEKYHQGQLTVVQALNEIRLVLTTIQGKI